MDRKSDELILQGLRQGDCKAFDELYMRYAPRVEAFACCMLKSRSEAEDLAHDIFSENLGEPPIDRTHPFVGKLPVPND